MQDSGRQTVILPNENPTTWSWVPDKSSKCDSWNVWLCTERKFMYTRHLCSSIKLVYYSLIRYNQSLHEIYRRNYCITLLVRSFKSSAVGSNNGRHYAKKKHCRLLLWFLKILVESLSANFLSKNCTCARRTVFVFIVWWLTQTFRNFALVMQT